MDNTGSKYYYSRLNDGQKRVYNDICGALLRFEPMLNVRRISAAEISKVMNYVLLDNPVFFYLNKKRVATAKTIFGLTLMFHYDYSENDAKIMWQKAQSVLDEFMQTRINPNMPPLAKQIEAHRWIQQNIKTANAPYTPECFSLVGALINKTCVCQGFAQTYKMICDRLHLASIIVSGTAIKPDKSTEPHAWNITRIDGVTSHIDVTWDTVCGIGSYDYFNLTDDEISADHIFDRTVYPKCNDNSLGYFTLNQLVARSECELKSLIAANRQKPHFSVKLEFPCTAPFLANCGFPPGELRYNEARNIVFYKR